MIFWIEAFLFFLIPFYLIAWLIIGFLTPKTHSIPPAHHNTLTLIIPYRNEALILPELLESLSNLHLIEGDEIILVDDQSSDGGIQTNKKHRAEIHFLKLPENQSGSKKEALSLGISSSINEWIITSDADCNFNPDFINAWRNRLSSKQNMWIGPVVSTIKQDSFVSRMHHAENFCLQLITLASASHLNPLLCSGANLLFRKSVWSEVGGYSKHLHIPSGDDVLLMSSFQRINFEAIACHFEEKNVVKTRPALTWKTWFLQRRRWASKSGHLENVNQKLHATLLLIWVFLFPIAVCTIGPIYFLMLIPELFLMNQLHRKINSSFNHWMWPIFRMLYPFLLLLLPFTRIIWPSDWKMRSFRQSKPPLVQ